MIDLQRRGLQKIPYGILICHQHIKHHWIFVMGLKWQSSLYSILGKLQSLFILGPTQNWETFRLLGKEVRRTCSNWVYVASKTQRDSLSVVVVGWSRCHSLSITLKGMSWYTSDHWASINFTKVAGPWMFGGFITYLLVHTCLNKIYKLVTTSCSPDPISILSSM